MKRLLSIFLLAITMMSCSEVGMEYRHLVGVWQLTNVDGQDLDNDNIIQYVFESDLTFYILDENGVQEWGEADYTVINDELCLYVMPAPMCSTIQTLTRKKLVLVDDVTFTFKSI